MAGAVEACRFTLLRTRIQVQGSPVSNEVSWGGRGPCFSLISLKVRGGAGRGAWAVATHGPCRARPVPREGGGGGAEIEFQALWLEGNLGHSGAQAPAPVPPWFPQPTHTLTQLSSCWPSPQDWQVRGKQGRCLGLELDILLGSPQASGSCCMAPRDRVC